MQARREKGDTIIQFNSPFCRTQGISPACPWDDYRCMTLGMCTCKQPSTAQAFRAPTQNQPDSKFGSATFGRV